MDRVRIIGGKPLFGEIPISGAKNAGLPLMAACLLTDEALHLVNLPHLADISSMAHLLRELGDKISVNCSEFQGGSKNRVLELDA